MCGDGMRVRQFGSRAAPLLSILLMCVLSPPQRLVAVEYGSGYGFENTNMRHALHAEMHLLSKVRRSFHTLKNGL